MTDVPIIVALLGWLIFGLLGIAVGVLYQQSKKTRVSDLSRDALLRLAERRRAGRL